MTRERIRVLCVDDHAFLAEGMKARLALEEDLAFVGWIETAEPLIDEARSTRADVVLLDVEMPGPDPFEVLANLRRQLPEVRTIILSAHVRDGYIDAAVRAGAWGYLSKSDDPDTVVEAIRRVAEGQFAFGQAVLSRLDSAEAAESGRAGLTSRLHRLTPRELQVLRMIGKGMSRIEIARDMHRSPKTIDNHRSAIMAKLEIRDRVELARYAIREGLTEA